MKGKDWSPLGFNPVPADGDELTRTASQWGNTAYQLDEYRQHVVGLFSNVNTVWRGTSADAFVGRAGAPCQNITVSAGLVGEAATALRVFAADVHDMQYRANQLLVRAQRCVDQLPPDAMDLASTPAHNIPPGLAALRQQYTAIIDELAVYRRQASDLLGDYLAAEQRCARTLEQLIEEADRALGVVPPAVINAVSAGDLTSIETALSAMSPEQIATFFADLPPGVAEALAHDSPNLIGNLDGVPAAIRSIANVDRVQADIDRVDQALDARGLHGLPIGMVALDPGRYGLTEQDVWAYNNAKNCLGGMAFDKDHMTAKAPVYLWYYDPTAYDGKGRCAITLGDPDMADNTAMFLVGVGSNVKNRAGNPDPINIYNQAAKADPSHTTAVVNWMGYDAPEDLYSPGTLSQNMAHHGSVNLANDVSALRLTHRGAPTYLTVVAHSYGSTTASDAVLDEHMQVNNLVLIGSPGAGDANHASDLVSAGHVYVGSAAYDPVTTDSHVLWTDRLGADPAQADFGATRFNAEWVGRDDGGFHGNANHSHYFDQNSESLYNVIDIVTGNGGHIVTDGNQALPRYGAVDFEQQRTPRVESH